MFDKRGYPDGRLGGRPLLAHHMPARKNSLFHLGQFEYRRNQRERVPLAMADVVGCDGHFDVSAFFELHFIAILIR